MPETKKHNIPIETLIPKRELRQLDSFKDKLLYIKLYAPFLALIGVDSARLGNALIEWIWDYSASPLTVLKDQSTIDLPSIAQKYKKGVIIQITPQLEDQNIKLARHLVYYRDLIVEQSMKFILIGDHELMKKIQRIAYDFTAISQVQLYFTDQLQITERELQPYPILSDEEQAYNTVKEELEAYLNQKASKPEVLMRKYFEAATKAYNTSRLSEAFSFYQNSLNLAYKIEDQYYISSVLGNIGLIYSDQGELDEALKYLKQALELHRQIGDLQGEASDLGNIGLIYKNQGQLDEALKYFTQAKELAEQLGLKDQMEKWKKEIDRVDQTTDHSR